ncbi:MAG: ribonuclease P protein component [Actinomycetota bacterium]|nr:ribonuclease P protein component [Actinomycetota bacterium]
MAPVVGRVRTKATFRALSRPDGRARRGPVSVDFSRVAGTGGLPLVGYAIGRRHGNAVARNRLRRRLRAAVRCVGPRLDAGAYLVRATPGAGELDFEALCRAVSDAARSAADRAKSADDGREGREG